MKRLNIPQEQIDEVVLDYQLRVTRIYYKKENPIVKENTNKLTQIFEDIETINSLKEDSHNIRKAQFEDVKEFERLYKENQQFKQAFEKTMENAFDRYMDSRIAEEVIDYIHISFYEFLKIGDME